MYPFPVYHSALVALRNTHKNTAKRVELSVQLSRGGLVSMPMGLVRYSQRRFWMFRSAGAAGRSAAWRARGMARARVRVPSSVFFIVRHRMSLEFAVMVMFAALLITKVVVFEGGFQRIRGAMWVSTPDGIVR